jgi:uncharacterized protein (TIGR03083 family)
VDYDQLVDAVERETNAMAAALRAGPLDVTVPSCPEWTLTELADHVGGFSGFWTHVLCEGVGRPKTAFSECPAPAEIPDWYADAGRHLVNQLRATPADATVWTWAPDDQSARFVARRAANELAVHRFDAQLARGAPEPIDAALAADGIDEIFVMIDAWPEPPGRGEGETLRLHGTDRDDEWLIVLTPDGPQVERGGGEASHHGPRRASPQLSVRAAVSDLELTLYQRPALGHVERAGDEAALAAWCRAFTFG